MEIAQSTEKPNEEISEMNVLGYWLSNPNYASEKNYGKTFSGA